MNHLQLILVSLAAFVLVLHATAVTAQDIEQDKDLMNKGYQEIAKDLPPAAKQLAQGLMEAVNNGDIDADYLKGIGKVIEVLLNGVGNIAGGALGD